jgi:hypothetical protein
MSVASRCDFGTAGSRGVKLSSRLLVIGETSKL